MKPPEGDHVDQAEGPAIFSNRQLMCSRKLWCFDIGRLLGRKPHHRHRQQHGEGGEAVDRLPAKLLRQRP